MSEDTKDRGFKVRDRRNFSEDAEPAKDNNQARPEVRADVGAPTETKSDGRAPDVEKTPREDIPLDFSSFILSLATGALIQMGDAVHPELGQASENLEEAKQTIDIISILKEKTHGNLTPEEGKLLENVLAELRFRFVQKKSQK